MYHESSVSKYNITDSKIQFNQNKNIFTIQVIFDLIFHTIIFGLANYFNFSFNFFAMWFVVFYRVIGSVYWYFLTHLHVKLFDIISSRANYASDMQKEMTLQPRRDFVQGDVDLVEQQKKKYNAEIDVETEKIEKYSKFEIFYEGFALAYFIVHFIYVMSIMRHDTRVATTGSRGLFFFSLVFYFSYNVIFISRMPAFDTTTRWTHRDNFVALVNNSMYIFDIYVKITKYFVTLVLAMAACFGLYHSWNNYAYLTFFSIVFVSTMVGLFYIRETIMKSVDNFIDRCERYNKNKNKREDELLDEENKN